jgi:flavin-dependent dehydrogenase
LFEPNGPGWQLDRTRFDAMLRRAAAGAGADVYEGARLALAGNAPSPSDGSLYLRLHGDADAGRAGSAGQAGQDVRCRWLIDAGGRSATLARQLGATRRRDDRLVAFYARLRCTGGADRADRDGRTLVEAVEDGWWYSVLLPSGERLVVRLGDADLLDRRRLLVGDGLWSTLGETRHLSRLCTEYGYAPSGPARGADASSSRLEPAAGERWLAVGDAALAFDPLSSKGIASALYTGLRAANAIDAALRGEGEGVRRYAAHLFDIYRVYREQLSAHYAAEARWPDAPFWRRRAAAGEGRAHG